jgi:hypothetical protein
MTLQGVVTGDASGSLTAFFRSYESLLAEERRLRSLAEERARAYAGVLAEVGRLLDPYAMDRRRRVDPSFPVSLDPAQWQVLFQEIVERCPATGSTWSAGAAGNTTGTTVAIGSMGQDEEVASLREQVFRLTEALRLAQAGAPASASGSSRPANKASSGSTGAGGTGAASPEPAADSGGQPAQARKPKPGPKIELPDLPLRAPGKYADLFRKPEDWQKKIMALAILGLNGWSFRLAVADAIAGVLLTRNPSSGSVSGMSGSWKNVYDELESAGLWMQRVLEPGNGLTAHIQVVNLTDLGRKVLRSVGMQPVQSEWDRLLDEHGGEEQAKHAALVVAFTYHARLRGYASEVCPQAVAPAEPDVLLTKGDDRIYVEVEAGSGEPERLLRKWRNQAGLQGYVAFCSTATERRKILAQDARHAADRGMATDLAALISWVNAEDYASIWAEAWP